MIVQLLHELLLHFDDVSLCFPVLLDLEFDFLPLFLHLQQSLLDGVFLVRNVADLDNVL